MENSFDIVVDTSCDLPRDYINEHNIEVLPIPFYLDDVEHSMGSWQEISDKEFYNALRNGSASRTSQINPETFVSVFTEYAKRGRAALFSILSGGLSSTYQNSVLALRDVKEAYPDCELYPIDSIGATSLSALLTMLTVEKRAEGLSAGETAKWLEEKKQNVIGIFTVDDLMYLHRGGRLSKLSAVGGSMLGIKPLLNIGSEGTLALRDKVRGREAALKTMVSQLKRSISAETRLDTVYITHSDCETDAIRLVEMLKDTVELRRVVVEVMGPVIGAHLGPGALTLVFEADMTREEYENKFYGGK